MLHKRRRRKVVTFTSNEHHLASKTFASNVAFKSKFGKFSNLERVSINKENASGFSLSQVPKIRFRAACFDHH